MKWGGDGSNLTNLGFKAYKPGSPYLCRLFFIDFCKEIDQYANELFIRFHSIIEFSKNFKIDFPNANVEKYSTMVNKRVLNACLQGNLSYRNFNLLFYTIIGKSSIFTCVIKLEQI